MDTPLFRKVDNLFGPFSTWTVHNSLDNVDARLPLTQGCLPPLIDSTTGYYNSTGMYSTTCNLWSAFLARVQQGTCLRSVQQHRYACIAMPTGNIPEASEIWTPL